MAVLEDIQYHASLAYGDRDKAVALAVSERVSQGYILKSSHKRQAQFLPCRHR